MVHIKPINLKWNITVKLKSDIWRDYELYTVFIAGWYYKVKLKKINIRVTKYYKNDKNTVWRCY